VFRRISLLRRQPYIFVCRYSYLTESTACYGDSFTFLYVDDVHTLQETLARPSTDCYGNRFSLFYVDDVHTSQETHARPSTACYGNRFALFYVDDVHTSQETHVRPSTASYRDSFALFYVDDVHTSQETHVRPSTASYRDSFALFYKTFTRVCSFSYVGSSFRLLSCVQVQIRVRGVGHRRSGSNKAAVADIPNTDSAVAQSVDRCCVPWQPKMNLSLSAYRCCRDQRSCCGDRASGECDVSQLATFPGRARDFALCEVGIPRTLMISGSCTAPIASPCFRTLIHFTITYRAPP
jgi:hypothetical protein